MISRQLKRFTGKQVDQQTAKTIYGEWMGTADAETLYCKSVSEKNINLHNHRLKLEDRRIQYEKNAKANLKFSIAFLIIFTCCLVGFIIGFVKAYSVYQPLDNGVFICGGIFGGTLICGFLIIALFRGLDLTGTVFDAILGGVSIVLGIGGAIGTPVEFILYRNHKEIWVCGLIFAGLVFSFFAFVCFIFITRKMKRKYKFSLIYGGNDKLMSTEEFLSRIRDLKAESASISERTLKAVAPYVSNIRMLHSALKKRFDILLDERDWKNLDLVIFYLETRRADSVKEALQLVDKELQTKRIEKMIGMAAQQINETLRMGFTQLQSTLEVWFESISNQLAEIDTQIQTANRQMYLLNTQFLSAQTLTEALLKKSNQSCEKMVDELRQIRNNSDYQTLMLRRY